MTQSKASTDSAVSRHAVAVYQALAQTGEWLNSCTVAERAQVAPRTARAHLRTLVERGVAECVHVFPGYRYRIVETARGRDYATQLRAAADALAVVPANVCPCQRHARAMQRHQ